MRLFKGFIIALTGLFIFVTLLSLFIPSKVIVTKAVTINATAEKVFTEMSDLQKWKHWQPVFKKDSSLIKFQTDSSGVSNSCEWESKGRKNKLLITGKKDNMITATLFRGGENDILNTIRVSPLQNSNQVQAEWIVMIKLKWYPWEKFYGIFIEKISGEGYQQALDSLKEYTENH
jgi:hypothetical protein